jgi:hypothetical protein
MPNPFLEQLKRLAASIGITNQNSWAARKWFEGMARRVVSMDGNQYMNAQPDKLLKTRNINASMIGKMIMYYYDPKTKDKLPYYDRFPLGFIVDLAPKGHYMINLHYLSPFQRAKLFDALYQATLQNPGTEKQRLKISYAILKSTSRLQAYKPCFKRYLSLHVRSRYLVVDPADWGTVMMLPLARFERGGKGGGTVGSPISQTKVWADSRKKIK